MSKHLKGTPSDHKMGELISFTRVERDLTPQLRKGLNEAESTEDVKKVFNRTIRELLRAACGPDLPLGPEDLVFSGEEEPYYRLDRTLLTKKTFVEVWDNSDLRRIMGDFAALSANRYRHLLKSPDKTEAKMHRSGQRRGRPRG